MHIKHNMNPSDVFSVLLLWWYCFYGVWLLHCFSADVSVTCWALQCCNWYNTSLMICCQITATSMSNVKPKSIHQWCSVPEQTLCLFFYWFHIPAVGWISQLQINSLTGHMTCQAPDLFPPAVVAVVLLSESDREQYDDKSGNFCLPVISCICILGYRGKSETFMSSHWIAVSMVLSDTKITS